MTEVTYEVETTEFKTWGHTAPVRITVTLWREIKSFEVIDGQQKTTNVREIAQTWILKVDA
jgi:hypothetical protein